MSNPNLFFPTPVWVTKIKDYVNINNDIYKYIKNMQSMDEKGVIKSNVNGWHSKNFNLADEQPRKFISNISENINSVLKDMNWDDPDQKIKISSMWAIINKGGAANARHHHGNSDISAAYYVRAPENCGDIVFYDPRPAPVFSHPKAKSPNSLNAMINSIKPIEGYLILFPSYLEHSVNSNISKNERIVISFNINIGNR